MGGLTSPDVRWAPRRCAARGPLVAVALGLLGIASACNAVLDFSEPPPRVDAGRVPDASLADALTDAPGSEAGTDGTTASGDAEEDGLAIDAPLADGADACAPLECDPLNCGTAGHDCLGGACVSGECQPIVLATGLDTPAFLAADPATLYLTEQGDASDLRAVGKDGGAMRTLVPSSMYPGQPGDLIVEAPRVYWGNDALVNVYAVGVDGAAPAIAFDGGQATPSRLTSDGVDVYWTGADKTLERAGLPAGTALPFGDDATGWVGRDVAVNGAGVFWVATNGTQSHVAFVPKGCAAPCSAQVLYVGPNGSQEVTGMAADDAGVYFADNQMSVLLSVGLDGGTTSVGTTGGSVSYLALDATRLYWTETLAAGDVKSLPRNGTSTTNPKPLATGRAYPRAIVVDDVALYWLEGPPGRLVKLAK